MLEGLTPPTTYRTCKVGQTVEKLEPSDAKILLQAVADENWGVKTLARELRARGLPISETPIYNHRKQTCACFS
jgi:hypothetical protein